MSTVFGSATNAKTLTAYFTLGGVDIDEALKNVPPKYEDYVAFKSNGHLRIVSSPKPSLKKAQSMIKRELEKTYTPPEEVHGFQRGRGIKTGAARHIGANYLLQVDIKNFFGSITRRRVNGLLRSVLPDRGDDFYNLLLDICIYKDSLPQGSPCSPIISNMIMFRFDNEIAKHCRSRSLVYTRYADDIIISSRKKSFPVQFAFRAVESDAQVAKLGPVLDRIFSENGFSVNELKTRLVAHYYRLKTLGLVVNEKLNLPREEARRLRTTLHNIESDARNGLEPFRRSCAITLSKPIGGVDQDDISFFKKHIRGRLYYLRYIKGDHDSTYRKLAKRYSSLDPDFKYDDSKMNLSHVRIAIRVEGSTDIRHLRSALKYFQARGNFSDLNMEFMPATNEGKGSENMMSDIHYKARNGYSFLDLEIYLFDRDEDKVVKSMADKDKNYKQHSKGLYSLIIPIPEDRKDKICIEHYYSDEQIRKLKTEDGRRLYFKAEFVDAWHKSEHAVYPLFYKRETLVADGPVYDGYTKKVINLRKGEFAHLVEEKHDMDFSRFKIIFEQICLIRQDYYQKDVLKDRD